MCACVCVCIGVCVSMCVYVRVINDASEYRLMLDLHRAV